MQADAMSTPTLPRQQLLGGRPWHVEAIMDGVAGSSIWLAAILTGYFFLRAFELPVAIGPVLLMVALAIAIARKSAAAQTPLLSPVGTRAQGLSLGLLTGLALIALAPILRIFSVTGGGDHPRAFISGDEAYNFMIAQGLTRSFPPPDLGYLGRLTTYHLGGPLMAEMFHRYGLAQLHNAFYGILPVLLVSVCAASIFRIVGRLSPTLSTEQKLLATLASTGIFTLDFYNIAWNIRNTAVTRTLSTETIFGGMPIVWIAPGFVAEQLQFASPLAITFFLALLANMDRAGWPALACGLFAIFLSKSSVFVPIGFAWGVYAAYCAIGRGNWRFFTAGVVGLVLCLFAKSYIVEPHVATLQLGLGYGFDVLAQRGKYLAQALHLNGGLAAAVGGAALLLLGAHAFGLSIARKMRAPANLDAPHLFAFGALCFIAAAVFCAFFVFQVDPRVQAGFYAIHRGIQHLLWRGFDTYVAELWKMSIGEARYVVACVFSVFAAAGIFHLYAGAKAAATRAAAAACIAIALIIGCWQSWQATFGPLPRSTKLITPQTADALAHIPVFASVILANDCAYDQAVELHLPLMNAGVAGVYGHQFWACNFMFGSNFAATDALDRLNQIQSFWQPSAPQDRPAFLRAAGITHLFVSLHVPQGQATDAMLQQAGWAHSQFRNGEYSIYSVEPR